ncbi:hypothetical protein J132_05160, partial [Termitomyces sp. J132]
LYLINDNLENFGKTLQNFPNMPEPQQVWNVIAGTDYVVEELKIRVDETKAKFNGEQLGAFNEVMDSSDNNLGKMIFIHSAGGCHETFVCNTLASAVWFNGDVAFCVASSEIAVLLLDSGRTAHSGFKIPFQLWIHPLPISREELSCLNSYLGPRLSSGMMSQCNMKMPLTLWIEGSETS